jgi:hypothetical protein
MNEPIRHHYVPVFYLRKWTGPDGRLFRYHRPHQVTVVSRLRPEHTGFEEQLYSLSGSNNEQMIETDFFSPVDNAAAPILERLISHGPGELDSQARSHWTRFIMSLQLRSPQSLAEVKEFSDQNIRETIERQNGEEYFATRQPGDPESAYEYALQHSSRQLANAHKAFLPGLIDHEIIGRVIINMRWAVLNLTAARRTLVTGDRPYTTSHGLADRSCLLSVPLSPNHLFVAANDIDLLRAVVAQRADDTVANSNNLMVRLAVQNVYSNTDGHLAFVDNRLRRVGDRPIPGIITRGEPI